MGTKLSFRRWASTSYGPSEAIAASLAVWWGAWVASPFWDTFSSTPTAKVMALLAPGWAWGIVSIVTGVLLFVFSTRGMIRQKRYALLFLTSFFVFNTVVIALANYKSTAVPVYIHIAIAYAFLWYEAGRRFHG